MECHYYLDTYPYSTLLGIRNEEPECGQDFCDSCGDCLDCYDVDPCAVAGEGSDHFWVRYVTQDQWDTISKGDTTEPLAEPERQV